MLKTIKAKKNTKGEVKLLEPVKILKESAAILTILENEIDSAELTTNKMLTLSEKSLAEDWNSKADSRWDSILKNCQKLNIKNVSLNEQENYKY